MNRFLMQALSTWKDRPGRKPLLVKGARQVGKTYLLKAFGETAFPACHYINFERDNLSKIFEADFNPSRILTELSFYLGRPINTQTDFLILDEIQACPKALNSLKYFHEEKPELAIAAAGSLLGVALSDESFPVGKVDHLFLSPMTFFEFLLGIGEQALYDYVQSLKKNPKMSSLIAHEKLWEKLKHYFIVGGLPAVVSIYAQHQKEDLFMAFEKVRECQAALIRDYSADMAKHAGKVNAMHLDRVWHSVASQLSKTQEGATQRFRFKDIVHGVDRYARLANVIDWLLNAGLILKSDIVKTIERPLSAYTQEGQFKLFIFDIGLLGAMSGLAPKDLLDQSYGTYKGYFAENFIAQNLVIYGPLFTWQEGTAEIEFVQEKNGAVIPIEVKSAWSTHAKSLSIFIKKYVPPYQIIYSAKNIELNQKSHTQYLPLYLAESE